MPLLATALLCDEVLKKSNDDLEMAVNFLQLPVEDRFEDKRPSRLVWTIIFFSLAIGGIFVVLLLWPKSVPTSSWKFWITITLFPLGVPTLIVLRILSDYEGRRESVELRNEAVHRYNESVFEVASRQFALVCAPFRVSADRAENTVEAIRVGAVRLTTQDPIVHDGEPVKARWLVVPAVQLTSGRKEDDRRRHIQVVKWLFDEMLAEMAEKINALPARLGLSVHLFTSTVLASSECEAIWKRCCHAHLSRDARVAKITESSADLGTLDCWLDQATIGECAEARLIVSVQLHSLLSVTPNAGVTEAGVALLLLPDLLCREYAITRIADLHRPVCGTLHNSGETLSNAIKWARTTAAHIPYSWQTGLNAPQAGKVREAALRIGLLTDATDLDQTVGHAGVAAPWLTTACAALSLADGATQQIVFVGQDDRMDCTVLKLAIPSTQPIDYHSNFSLNVDNSRVSL